LVFKQPAISLPPIGYRPPTRISSYVPWLFFERIEFSSATIEPKRGKCVKTTVVGRFGFEASTTAAGVESAKDGSKSVEITNPELNIRQYLGGFFEMVQALRNTPMVHD
jgi:hypothetical protein